MTIIIFLLILAILILVHEFGHFITAKKSGIKVEEFGIGFPPKLISWKPKGSETTYSINLIPFGGFVKIFGEDPDAESISGPDSERSFVNKPKSVQALVLAAGVIFNIIFAWILISFGFWYGLPTTISDDNREYATNINLTITTVLPESPAEEVGLRSGDAILNLSNPFEILEKPTDEEVQSFILKSDSQEFEIEYKRGEEISKTKLTAEEGIVDDGLAVGIAMNEVGTVKFPLLKSIQEGTLTTISLLSVITVGITNFIVDAFSGGADLSQVSGPVGIIGLVGDASDLGIIYLLSFTALISLHLAILNLIPFPALDGGRILFVIIEAIIRKPINPKIQNWLNGIGFALLILLMLIVTYNDILKLF